MRRRERLQFDQFAVDDCSHMRDMPLAGVRGCTCRRVRPVPMTCTAVSATLSTHPATPTHLPHVPEHTHARASALGPRVGYTGVRSCMCGCPDWGLIERCP
eukprot:6447830-Prymnesium_polylepis.1